MRSGSIWLATALLAVLALPTACDDTGPLAPPTLHLGEDVCYVCSMIISDERYAGAIVLRRDGRIVTMSFDDVGEMLEFDPDDSEFPIEEIRWFAKDAASREWIDAEEAIFLESEDLQTPMGTGIAALAEVTAAEALRAEKGGALFDFKTLRARLIDEG